MRGGECAACQPIIFRMEFRHPAARSQGNVKRVHRADKRRHGRPAQKETAALKPSLGWAGLGWAGPDQLILTQPVTGLSLSCV
ncbi:hypothetical protein GUJ93_ZPchr0010g10765 [Zizania palustris]|uniref:Uncharacterized protein n=1 Tax=Zizania palustris TaxID=103762 RepID=A0A8J5WHB0_ZIZPA|nr:hypothetical protein GUJ93_ZPchr0010g10765 [Zizania palustris]